MTNVYPAPTVPPALNPEFSKFLTTPRQGGALPLAIRRFMAEIGSSQPEKAMQLAAVQALAAYGATFSPVAKVSQSEGPIVGPVSVERLCAVMDIELVAPQMHARPVDRSDYGTAPYSQHPACVEFARPRPIIKLPLNIGWARGRVAAAHEIGHVLIHKREYEYDEATIRLGPTPEEEVLAEYAARLLLLPGDLYDRWVGEFRSENLALASLKIAQRAQVSLHTAIARMGDPDIGNRTIRGAILWRLENRFRKDPGEHALTPYWHLCPGAYIPVGRCKARTASLIGELALETDPMSGSRVEDVNVGGLHGKFLVDAFAWGSLADRTRVVLSVFQIQVET